MTRAQPVDRRLINRRPVVGVGIACFRDDQVLLIRRGRPPRRGEWSIPGGKLEFGETAREGALRELREETGVTAEIVGLIDVVDAIDAERHWLLVDFAARWLDGEPRAGDDAAEAAFTPLDEALKRVAWDETRRILALGAERVAGPAALGAGVRAASALSRQDWKS